MKRIVTGILAHVDSGKTTLSEALLYVTGNIRKLGRVDHKDTFLDNHYIEQARGITIFSHQAVMEYKGDEITLLDTPGHVDFSAETERTLRVLDYAILVISASEGVQNHTETLWKMLSKYNIPTFIFINKMDMAFKDRDEILVDLKEKISENCVILEDREDVAVCSDKLMSEFLEKGDLGEDSIKNAIKTRQIFPCFYGSALKLEGIVEFLDTFFKFTGEPEPKGEFAARVFKLSVGEKGERLTHMKITGGKIKVRDNIEYTDKESEKVNSIRIYSGEKYRNADEVSMGQVCAVTGLLKTYAGMGLGMEEDYSEFLVEPVLTYKVDIKDETDINEALKIFKKLEEEEPQYKVIWNGHLSEIHIGLMGEVQLEVLRQIVLERFGLLVEFTDGNILYKETIKSPTEGVGHFEPLRHYAEVHLLLKPLPQGSGLKFTTNCREDKLDKNWQRLILTHLAEKSHLGVLTGSPITDMEICLIDGRAHLKHTEGGDFREATYRALRQGLMMSESVLLEPWYSFKLKIPFELCGRAMTDIVNMGGKVNPPENDGENTVLTGECPVSEMKNYQAEVTAYTRGKGRLFLDVSGYKPCHNAEEIIEKIEYDAEGDIENTPDSVFCSHGAGFTVKWDKVRDYMHIDTGIIKDADMEVRPRDDYKGVGDEDELMRIFEKTYGPIKREAYNQIIIRKKETSEGKKIKKATREKGDEYLLVDGYNIIFAWDELKTVANQNLESARERLIEILAEYNALVDAKVILVFDAYKVKNNPGEMERVLGIDVVYTKEAETADMYIERVTHQLGKKHRVRVATSDRVEQIIILAGGALRVSAEEFQREVNLKKEEIRSFIKG